MRTYWIILILTIIPTLNVPISINLNIKIVSDHYADHSLFDHCADHHMSKSYVVMLMHNTVFLFVILKYAGYQKKHSMHNSDTIISHCICHSVVKLLYIWEEKREIGIEKNLELKSTSLCTTTMHIELCVCFYCLLLWTVNAYFIWTVNIDICCNCMNICEWTLINIYLTTNKVF